MFFSISLCVPTILQPVWESGTFLEAKSQICTGNSPNGNGNVAMSFGFMKGTVCINEGLNGGFVNFRLQEAQSTREIWPGVNCRILQIAYQTRKSQLSSGVTSAVSLCFLSGAILIGSILLTYRACDMVMLLSECWAISIPVNVN